jgi:hypothetical protein
MINPSSVIREHLHQCPPLLLMICDELQKINKRTGEHLTPSKFTACSFCGRVTKIWF